MKLIHSVLFGDHHSAASRLPAGIALTLSRVFFGLSISLAHGLAKTPPSETFIGMVDNLGFPLPPVAAWAAALSEMVGGILLALGLLTRPAAFFIIATMLLAAFVVHGSDPFAKKELALLYTAGILPFLVMGGGRFSLDRFFRKSS